VGRIVQRRGIGKSDSINYRNAQQGGEK